MNEVDRRQTVDQNPHPALGRIAAAPQVFARQGAVVASWRYYAGRKLGPYFRLAYREDGRQRSIYLGKAGKLVEEVKAALATAHAWLNESRTLRRLKKRATAALKAQKAVLDRQLRGFGLDRKGWEVRGFRAGRVLSVFRSPRTSAPGQETGAAAVGEFRPP